jgi:hypothetical protein
MSRDGESRPAGGDADPSEVTRFTRVTALAPFSSENQRRYTPSIARAVACHHGVSHKLYTSKAAGTLMPSQIQ